MSSTPPTGGRLLVEPLEARIAPTGLTALANDPNSTSDPNYVTYTTPPAAGHLNFVPASTLLGASAPQNLYAIKLTGDGTTDSSGLSTGDKLLIFNPTTGFNPTTPFLQATNHTLAAFFQDLNNDGQVQANELVGISLTKKTSANINGNVNGDIVTSLSKDGTTINLNGLNKAGFAISGLSINGNVNGNILAGGDINNVSVLSVNNVYAGTAGNGVAIHLAGSANPATGTVSFPDQSNLFPLFRPGASINNLSVTAITSGDTIQAGDGGFGAVGGNITGLAVLADTGAFNVFAGNGGVGNDVYKGAMGGSIVGATIVGVTSTDSTQHNQIIHLQAGHGGEDDQLRGGKGGMVSGVATSFANGFDPTTNTGTLSADLLTQNIIVQAGDGGIGLKGGRGGDVTSSSIFGAAPDDGVFNGGVANAEIQVLAGHGGLQFDPTQFHGGKGGSISQVFAESRDTNADGSTSSVLVQAGDGGVGKDGGLVTGVNVLGPGVTVNGGNGGDGLAKGGPGGSLDTINILSLTNLFTHQLTLNAGSGGASRDGAGGAGGTINAVTMLDSDLHNLAVNQPALVITGGAGGVGNNGLGGTGGAVTNIQLNDSDVSGLFASAVVRAGVGGDGHAGGGNGGAISQFQMFGSKFSYAVTAGAGGSVLDGGAGAGGNGGFLDTVGVSSVGNVDQIGIGQALSNVLGSTFTTAGTAETGTATAGRGGDGTTSGGTGGDLSTVDLRASFDVTMTAGQGGSGHDLFGGNGGSITGSAGVSLGGAFAATAGKGADLGSGPVNGGSITSVIASAQTDITMTAGAGVNGGSGGSITGSGTTPNPVYVNNFGLVNLTTSNFGNVLITAGAGSSSNGTAGTGGSVTAFNGSIGLAGAGDFSSFAPHTTAITAGAGGGGDGQTASGAGGSVSQLQLKGNNSGDNLFGTQIVTVDGGAAGSANAAKRGAAGGSVSDATIYNLDGGTIVQHIAAGDGGSALRRGGLGGSITEIHVGRPGDPVADIGIRSGVAFGYGADSAGGLFAGAGGTGSKAEGLSGDVTNVTANAISSIVAGKTGIIQLANNVDGIILEGNTAAVANADGSFANFDVANLIGSVQDPAAAGANTFHVGDGLVAARNFTANRDLVPEALLTFFAGTLEFSDIQQPNPTPAVTTNIPVPYSL